MMGAVSIGTGDALIVENACVHQHLNDDPNEEAIVLVAKAKPLFLFMHLIFQKIAGCGLSTEGIPGGCTDDLACPPPDLCKGSFNEQSHRSARTRKIACRSRAGGFLFSGAESIRTVPR
jgi:hypothetical protein